MFSCPHCQYILTGKVSTKIENGTSDTHVKCTHCSAILRVQITTLKDPEQKPQRVNS